MNCIRHYNYNLHRHFHRACHPKTRASAPIRDAHGEWVDHFSRQIEPWKPFHHNPLISRYFASRAADLIQGHSKPGRDWPMALYSRA
jgi:hypothetical protein